MATLRASVIVPVYNGESTIEECLRCLAGQTLQPEEYEILIVDDGSTDRTPALVDARAAETRSPAIRLLRQERSGPAVARNLGAREARGEVLLFTDSDCFPEPDWVIRMLAAFDDPAVVGAKGVYRTTQRNWIARFVQLEYESKYRRMARFRFIDFVDTYSAAFRREVFLGAGGYDPEFRKASVEDQEFSFRLAEAGHRMVFVPDAVVRHLHVDALGGYSRKKFRIGLFKALLLTKHPGRLSGDAHTPRSLQAQILLALLALPVAVLCLVGWLPWWALLTVALAYVASMVPFLALAARKDLLVAVSAPLVITLRSLALGSGLIAGLAKFGPATGRPKRR